MILQTQTSALGFLEIVGIIDSIILVIIIVRAVVLWVRGISPALWRLGNGLATGKIAIFAGSDNLLSLKGLLVDSKIFKEKNIIEITGLHDIGRAEKASVYLVFWHDWDANIDAILNMKPDACALVVYAPYNLAKIPVEQMIQLDGKRHTAVTNFRGRLLNDIITSMITTSYEPRR